MATVVKDLGAVTAYAYAVEGGYTGTESEFEALLGNIAEDLSEIENLSVTVTTLPAGSSATASYNNGVLSLGIPKGDKGDKGDTGATGATGPQGIPGDVANLASAYSTSSTYGVGDYCIYNSQLYRCITAITTAEAWTAAHWTAAVLGDDVSELKSALSSVDQWFMAELGSFNGATFVDEAYRARVHGVPHKRYQKFKFNYPSTLRYYACWKKENGSWSAVLGITDDTYTATSSVEDFVVLFVNKTNSSTAITPEELENTYLSIVDVEMDEVKEDITGIETDVSALKTNANNVRRLQTTFIKPVSGGNIFDKNDSEIESGKMINPNGTTTSLSSQSYKITGYMEIEPSTVYSVYNENNSSGQYGANVYITAQFYDANKTRLGNAVGTMDSSGKFYTVTSIANAVYMRVNLYDSLDAFMVVKGSSYRSAYSYYPEGYKIEGVDTGLSDNTNPLFEKTIVWDGDSICAGKAFNDTHDAWAGRIAANNHMIYKNYAVGGGTITENVVQSGVTKHSVCANLETMHTEYPNADYVVFDGGCNDADLLGNMITGTPERLGTFTLSDFSGVYDEDTFCGAFESILYRMTNYWRNAKFAYIIPHKMGILNEYRTDYTKEHHNYRAYYDLAIQMCIKWGVKYLDLWDNCFFCPMIGHLCDTYREMTQQEIYDAGMVYADRQHLTEHGYDLEATMIGNWLKTI